MSEFTKSNPGCHHSALKYLSQITGIDSRKEITKPTLASLRSKSGKQLLYRSYDIQVIDKDGNKFAYMQAGNNHSVRFDQIGIIADHFIITVDRQLEEFGVNIKGEGNYNDSLGGGWHQTVSLYSINGKFFADMECACR